MTNLSGCVPRPDVHRAEHDTRVAPRGAHEPGTLGQVDGDVVAQTVIFLILVQVAEKSMERGQGPRSGGVSPSSAPSWYCHGVPPIRVAGKASGCFDISMMPPALSVSAERIHCQDVGTGASMPMVAMVLPVEPPRRVEAGSASPAPVGGEEPAEITITGMATHSKPTALPLLMFVAGRSCSLGDLAHRTVLVLCVVTVIRDEGIGLIMPMIRRPQ